MISISRPLSILLLLSAALLPACKPQTTAQESGNRPEAQAAGDKEPQTAAPADFKSIFHLPPIPVLLTDPEERMEYLAQHYWDCITATPTDTALLRHPEETEQAWANYCDLLHHLPTAQAREAIKPLLPALETEDMKLYVRFKDLTERYLDHPNSPLRSEEIYIGVLQAMTESTRLGDMDKIRPRERLKLALKNRPGHRASNFTYTLAHGRQGTLNAIHSEYTLLFFNNPGCEACAATIGQLAGSPLISRLTEEHRLTVLALYPDEELDEWRRHLPDFPSGWTNGYDKEQVIRNKQLYDLRAIPSLYLLDKEKNVLLKDAPPERVLEFLEAR